MSETRESKTVVLSARAVEVAEHIQKLTKLDSIEEVLRRALGHELFIQEREKANWTFLIRKNNEVLRINWEEET